MTGHAITVKMRYFCKNSDLSMICLCLNVASDTSKQSFLSSRSGQCNLK